MNANENPLKNVEVDFFELGESGSKVLALVCYVLSNNNGDLIVLDGKTLKRWNVFNSNRQIGKGAFSSGIDRLKKARIISLPITKGVYFVNPKIGGNHE